MSVFLGSSKGEEQLICDRCEYALGTSMGDTLGPVRESLISI